MILITKTSDQMYVCIYIYITVQFGPVIKSFYATRIDPPKGELMILVTNTSDQTRQSCMYVCMYVCIYVCMYVYIYVCM